MSFFFDYIYYRITKLYFKWDGRTGATAIMAISLSQLLVINEILNFLSLLIYDRNTVKAFVPTGKVILIIVSIILMVYNYKKYNGTYNKFKFHWKDESKRVRLVKGLLVIICLLVPWIPLFFISF